jgi:hypothetical protein
VDEVIKQLPRHLNDDQAINVNLKKGIIYKSAYLSGYVKKSVLKVWLSFLVEQPLYKFYNITVNWSRVDGRFKRRSEATADSEATATDDTDIVIETLNTDTVPDSEKVHARHTMHWNEEHCLGIAPGQRSIPLNIVYDIYSEELSFQSITVWTDSSKTSVSVTLYMMATSETRRSDRRGTEASNDHLKQFLNDKFRLVLATDPSFKNTTINLTFSRDINVACKSYISYYSYHCPVFNKMLQISQHCEK